MKKKIALLTTGWAFEYVFAVLDGIREAIKHEQIDLYLFLCYGYYDETPAFNQGEYNIFNLIDYKDFDGVLLCSNIFNSLSILEREKQKILQAEIPVVSLEYEVSGIDYVSTDNYAGMHEMVNHLIKKHKITNFSYIGGPDHNVESAERERAFLDALKESNIALNKQNFFRHGNWSYEFAYESTMKMIENGKPFPEAIVCVNDEGAIAAITALHKHGYIVPEDTIVVGFDDTAVASLFTPSLSTVNCRWDCLGHDAILHLLKLINHESVDSKEILIPSVIPRGSCGFQAFSDMNQRNYCVNKFYQQKMTLSFNRHLRHIEEIFIETEVPQLLWDKFRSYLIEDHEIEGSDFCILMEKDIVPTDVLPESNFSRTEGHSDELRVIINLKDGKEAPCEPMLNTKQLFPKSMLSNQNDMFVFVPFHFQDTVLGYYVGKNSFDLIDNRLCYDWSKGISNGLAKFCEKYAFALMNQKITEMYIRDSLTGLLNRRGFKKSAYSLFEENQKCNRNTVVMFADINSMKTINDDYGHLHGDLAIKTVAEIIEKHLPQDWLKIRFGGDEYLVIGSDVTDEQFSVYREKVIQSLKHRTTRMSLPYKLTISIGSLIIEPNNQLSLDEAIRQADEIMYHNKTEYYHKENTGGRANKHNLSDVLSD